MVIDFDSLAAQCIAGVDKNIMQAIVTVESGFNPYAIGVVGGKLERQPKNQEEATATAKSLEALGYNYSLGLGQVNKIHLKRFGLNHQSVFDPCANLQAGATIFQECQTRASQHFYDEKSALKAALSCYYSGNFSRGQQREGASPSYADKVLKHRPDSAKSDGATKVIPVTSSVSHSAVMKKTQAVHQEKKDKSSWDVFSDF